MPSSSPRGVGDRQQLHAHLLSGQPSSDPGSGAVRDPVSASLELCQKANGRELSPGWEGWAGTRLPLRGEEAAGGASDGLAWQVSVLFV